MKPWKKYLSILFCIILAILGAVFLYNYYKPHPNYADLDAVYSIKVESLFDSFQTNSQLSSEKYNGKMIEISGIVSNIENSGNLIIIVFELKSGTFGPEGIRCTLLPIFNAQARNISPLDTLTIKGYCAGYNEIDIMLNKCSILKL